MLNNSLKNSCKLAFDVFQELYLILREFHGHDVALQVATELAKIVYLEIS